MADLDILADFCDEYAPQHSAVLHLKASELHCHVLKIGHVQSPRQGPAAPAGPSRQVTTEATHIDSRICFDSKIPLVSGFLWGTACI